MHHIFLDNAMSTASVKTALWVPLCKPKKLFQQCVLFSSEVCSKCVHLKCRFVEAHLGLFCWMAFYDPSITLQWHRSTPMFSHRSLCSSFVDSNQNIPFCIVCCWSHLQKRTPVPYHFTCMWKHVCSYSLCIH